MKEVEREKDAFSMHQTPYTSMIALFPKVFSPDEFSTLSEKITYAAASTRPDASCISAQLAQLVIQNADGMDRKLINEAVNTLQKERDLIFRKLMKKSISIVGYSDESFAGNADLSSQLGMFVLLFDENLVACVIHYA